ncbi:MAG: ELM1/GtrOC1 family putative glycosyltransferase [Geminicoccaceae bacterium]
MSGTGDEIAQASPRVWLLLAEKLGDNAQVLALAAALPWPCETRNIRMKSDFQMGKPRFRPGLDHLDEGASDELAAPWPDIVITIGRRAAMVALWIKERSPSTRIVLVGRPKRWLERFDLVISPPQFRLPDAENVFQLQLPLMRADPGRVAEAARQWRSRLESMPRPLTAVLVGGQTQPFRFDADAAGELARRLSTSIEQDGGSLFVTTSRRTGPIVVDTLASRIRPPSRIFRFGIDHAEDNPYQALLGLADRFVVTGDSVSMQVEVLGLGKPLAIFPLPLSRKPHVRLWRAAGRLLEPGAPIGECLRRAGISGFVRDLSGFHEQLYRDGLAVPLGQPFRQPAHDIADEVDEAASRVVALLNTGAHGGPTGLPVD